jgi:hypothetical protein
MIWNSDLGRDARARQSTKRRSCFIPPGTPPKAAGPTREGYPERNKEDWLECALTWRDDAGRVRFDNRAGHRRSPTKSNSFPPTGRVY